MKRLLAAVITAGTMLAGCTAAEPEAAEPAPTVTVTVTTTATKTVTADPEPPEPPDEPLALGESYEAEDVTLTVFEMKDNIRADYIEGVATAVSVKLCVTSDITAEVSGGPWSLLDNNDGRWDQFVTSPRGDLPGPNYPNYVPISQGECVSGWIYWERSPDVEVVQVRYDHPDFSVSWDLT